MCGIELLCKRELLVVEVDRDDRICPGVRACLDAGESDSAHAKDGD
jgi:hypothetical protein